MASTGKAKFDKYFKNSNIDTVIAANHTKVYDLKGNLLPFRLASNTPVRVPAAKEYNPQYFVQFKHNGRSMSGFVSESTVAKPAQKSGATEGLRIKATDLVSGGKKEFFDYEGKKEPFLVLSSALQTKKSIMEALKRNKFVEEHESIIKTLEKYFESGNPNKIVWLGNVTEAHKNELGKYLGEVLFGYTCFRNSTILGSPAAKIMFPVSTSFAGIDSIIITKNGDQFNISSKYGRGAAASFFANLFVKALDKKGLKVSYLQSLVAFANTNGYKADDFTGKGRTKSFIYEYGIRQLLKINKQKIKDTDAVLQDILTNYRNHKTNFSADTLSVVDAAKKFAKGMDHKITDQLPFSLTTLFSKAIVDRLQNDKTSMDLCNKIIQGKGYYQVNLDIKKWVKGDISFKIEKAFEMSLKFTAGKSAIGDPVSSQGTINYILSRA